MKTPRIDAILDDNWNPHWRPSEETATFIGNDRQALKERLLDAVTCYHKDIRKALSGAVYSFEHKSLTARDGSVKIVWRLRQYPDRPIAYENQQTNLGYVGLYWQSCDELYWVSYTTGESHPYKK